MTKENKYIAIAREVYDNLERSRGVFHHNDKTALIELYAQAIEAAVAEDRLKARIFMASEGDLMNWIKDPAWPHPTWTGPEVRAVHNWLKSVAKIEWDD